MPDQNNVKAKIKNNCSYGLGKNNSRIFSEMELNLGII